MTALIETGVTFPNASEGCNANTLASQQTAFTFGEAGVMSAIRTRSQPGEVSGMQVMARSKRSHGGMQS